MARIFSRLHSIKGQLVIAIFGLMMLAIGAVSYLGYSSLSGRIQEDIDQRTHSSLRVATRMLMEGVPIFAVERNAQGEPERLKVVSSPTLLDNLSAHELTMIVDGISDANRGTATIFRWKDDKKDFVRIATTVKKPDGTRAVGTVLGQTGVVYPFMMRNEAYRGVAHILGEPYQTGYLPIVTQKGEPVGVLYIGVGKIADLSQAQEQLLRKLEIGAVLALALGILFTLLATSRILGPLDRVTAATNALTQGNGDVVVPHQDRGDQIGQIARAVHGFREAVEGQRMAERARAEDARQVAARKLAMETTFEEFRTSISDVLAILREGAEGVSQTSSGIRAVVERANARVRDGRNAADQGAGAISGVATSTNEFAGSIAEIAARTQDAASVVRDAAQSGRRAEAVAGELSGTVERISAAAAVISSIASQTNLLALNATIEAARAGELGRGFAVVASEVKELSNGTSRAAAEIAELVRTIEDVTNAVSVATRDIGRGLNAISDTTDVIASAVGEQEKVTRDIAANADAAAETGSMVQAGFAEVESAIAETADAANALDAHSRDFLVSTDHLIGEVQAFLKRMAA